MSPIEQSGSTAFSALNAVVAVAAQRSFRAAAAELGGGECDLVVVFASGGLLAAPDALLEAIHEHMGVDLPLSVLLDAPTIAESAARGAFMHLCHHSW